MKIIQQYVKKKCIQNALKLMKKKSLYAHSKLSKKANSNITTLYFAKHKSNFNKYKYRRKTLDKIRVYQVQTPVKTFS